jgi:transposase
MGLVAKDDGWRIPDWLWAQIEPLLPPRPTHPLGCHRPRVCDRAAMNAIFFVARTGCTWNSLNATAICHSSSAHRRFQEWRAAGVFEQLWRGGLELYDEHVGIDWQWLAMDGAITKAPLGGCGHGPKSHRQSQEGHQTIGDLRRRRHPDRPVGRRRQPPRPEAA